MHHSTEKIVKFLRNREIPGVSRKTGAGDLKDSAVFSTEEEVFIDVFQTEFNKALQRRKNNRRQKEFKTKKLLERNHTTSSVLTQY